MQAAAGNNETGFWEHQDAVDAHEALLAAFGMRWSDPRRLPDGWEETPAADTARAAIRTIIAEQFDGVRSEEHTSELQSLMRISYAVFCLKKNNKTNTISTLKH